MDQTLSRVACLAAQNEQRPFADLPWDAPGCEIVEGDARLIFTTMEPLIRTDWFRDQSVERQSAFCLARLCEILRLGVDVEHVLQVGLLRFMAHLNPVSPAYRLAHHEIIEESQHTLVFQEFMHRAGCDQGAPLAERLPDATGSILAAAESFPALFFLAALAGEMPFDASQRLMLRQRAVDHPLVNEIWRYHIADEARHISFAKHYVAHRMATHSQREATRLRRLAPVLVGRLMRRAVGPPWETTTEFGVPDEVVENAYSSAYYQEEIGPVAGRVVNYCRSIGLETPTSRQSWNDLEALSPRYVLARHE